jgi:hypothetical protein
MGREGIGANGSYELPEPEIPYEGDFALKNDDLRQENPFYWDILVRKSMGWLGPTHGKQILTFPLSNEVALITREDKHGTYEAIDEVVAWVNSRTVFGSMGLVYSESPDFLLLRADNSIGRSKDYLKYLNDAWSRGILNP